MRTFQKFKSLFLKSGLYPAVLLALIAPLACLQLYHPQGLHSFLQIIAHFTAAFTLARWLFILSVMVFWSRWIAHLSDKNEWLAEKTIFWQQQRWRVVGWLVVIECLVCEDFIHLVLKGLGGIL